MATAFAVFCSEDGSLNFYKRDAVPAVGDTFEGKVVDNIYLNVEQKYYSKIAELSWYADGTYQNITSVNCVDEISPEVLWGWFYQCSNLTYVNLRKLDTKNTTNMKMTFEGCSSLQSLDLSNFNTVSVINMQQMFRNCSNLATIYVSELWSTDNLTKDRSSFFMFDGCTALSGDISYVGTYTDKTYATYTGGYFTYKKYYPLEICGDFIIQGETLYDLANKIRVLSGSEDAMTPVVMASELDAVAEKMDGALFIGSKEVTAQIPSSASWSSVAYGNGRFVTVAQNSTQAAYSDDGINWIAATLPSYAIWLSVAYGNGRFVTVAQNSTKAAYSDDGINWTAATLPSQAYWTSVTYGSGQFVAVAYSSSTVVYSEDGINWSETTLPSSASWMSVICGNDRFVTITSAGTNNAAYSDDGINWTGTTLPSYSNWSSVAYGDGRFVVVAHGNKSAAYSNNGINWAPATLPSSAIWFSVAYGNGRFVTVARNSTQAAYSDDGINWTETVLPSSADWFSVTYGNGRFVAVAYNSTAAAYSDDGINWTDKAPGQTIIVNNSNADVTEQTIQQVMPLDTELSAQDDLIAQITAALDGKMVPSSGASVETCTVTVTGAYSKGASIVYTAYENGAIVPRSSGWDGTFANVVCGSAMVFIGAYLDAICSDGEIYTISASSACIYQAPSTAGVTAIVTLTQD